MVRPEKSRRKVVRKIREVCWVVCPEEAGHRGKSRFNLAKFSKGIGTTEKKGSTAKSYSKV